MTEYDTDRNLNPTQDDARRDDARDMTRRELPHEAARRRREAARSSSSAPPVARLRATVPVQATYSEGILAPPPGVITGSGEKTDVITGNCEPEDGIPFGVACSHGDVANFGDKAAVLGGDLAKFRGISVRDITLVATSDPTMQDVYPQYSNMSIMTRGEIWVEPATAVVAGEAVHFDAATGVLSNAGGVGPIVGARWTSSCAAEGRATLYLPG